MKLNPVFLLIALLVQLAILGAMVAQKGPAKWSDTTILLKVAPYDPYSVLSGYYAVLTYDISRLSDVNGWDLIADETIEVYVELHPGDDGAYHAHQVFDQYPVVSREDAVVLKGKRDRSLIKYDIETYYVEETKRHEVDSYLRSTEGQNYAEIGVDSRGNATIRALHLGGGTY